jgi:DNA-binding GntR family transcriptional regulator
VSQPLTEDTVHDLQPGTAAAAFDRRTSGDQVAGYIRELIFSGQLRRGDRIRQDDVAGELRVSRIPVREAMIALDREGWVTIEPHRGAYVNGLDSESVADHYEVLGMLYGLAGRRAAEHGSDEEIRRFSALRKAVSSSSDAASLQRHNEAFIRHMYGLARSPRLSSVSRVITGIVPGNFFDRVPGATELQKKGIGAVAKALASRDQNQIEAQWLALLRVQGAAVVELLRSNGVVVDK